MDYERAERTINALVMVVIAMVIAVPLVLGVAWVLGWL